MKALLAMLLTTAVGVGAYLCFGHASGSGRDDEIARVDKDDPRIVAARDEARRRWPEFVVAFNEHKAGRQFSVKYPFPTRAGGREHFWIAVEALDGDRVRGTMDNDPVGEVNHKAGDPVSVPASEISDWMYEDEDGTTVGGFTAAVLGQIRQESGNP